MASGPQGDSAVATRPRPRPGKRRRWLILALLAAAGIGAFLWLRRPTPPAPPPSALVEAADIEQRVQAAGIVQARLLVTVGAQASGQVRTLHVQLGQHVNKGDPLLDLDPEIARNEVRRAEATAAQQQAQIDATRVDLEQARRELTRQQRLVAGDAAAAVDLEKARNDLAKFEAQLRLQQATATTVQTDLEKARLNLGFTQILAPIDGDVVDIAVQAGQTVNAAQTSPVLMTLARLDTVTVKAQVAEADIGRVRLGQPASFVTLGDAERRHQGTVRLIQPQPEKINNASFYAVLFDVPNADRALMLGMSVQVALQSGKAAGAPSIPLAALGERDADGRYAVQVLQADGKTAPRRVRVGLSDPGRAQVLDGLKLGERVLLDPPAAASAPVAVASGAGPAPASAASAPASTASR